MAGNSEQQAQWVLTVLGIDLNQPADVAQGGTTKFSPVAVGKACLEWRNLCRDSVSELQKLKNAIVTACSGEDWDPDETEEVLEQVEELDAALNHLDSDLADTVDDFINAPEGQAKIAAQKDVLAEIADYENLVTSDDLLADVDSNEFLNTGLKQRALKALAALKQGFAAAA
jgi:hypothetical protein